PYGIGSSSQPYQSFFSPDPNSVGSLSNVYDVLNPPYPYKSESESANWLGTANKINSEPSMHGEHGFNVAKAIPEWRYNIEDSQMYPLRIPDIIIPPSGTNPLAETDNSKQLQAGIEIELEGTNLKYPISRFWNGKSDGSLRGDSMEYILRSPVHRDKTKSRLLSLKTELEEYHSTLNPSDRCGVHIHIKCQDAIYYQVRQCIKTAVSANLESLDQPNALVFQP
ncbi:hypothetical protein LCGC14_2877970, partial [marine sediment metagenome]